jgi:hypothetical protein
MNSRDTRVMRAIFRYFSPLNLSYQNATGLVNGSCRPAAGSAAGCPEQCRGGKRNGSERVCGLP